MGTWGVGIFDNDDAQGWIADFADRGSDAIVDSFDRVENAKTVSARNGRVALAAAFAVAACRGTPITAPTTAFRAALDRHRDVILHHKDLDGRAAKTIDKILKRKSELMQQWKKSQHGEAWEGTVGAIRARLG